MRILKKLVRKLYHLIWFLSLFVLFCIPKVNAVVNGNAIFVGQQLDTIWTIANNGSKSGNTWFSSNTDFTGNFIYADVCTTGFEPTISITSDIEGKAIASSRWYKVDVPCYADGYQTDVYRQIIYVTSVQYEKSSSSSGSDYFTLQFGSRIFSNTDYITYMRLLHLGMSENIPLDDLIYDQNTTEISILKDILAELRANPNVDQEILQSNQAILQQEQQANQKLDSIDDALNDDNVDGANSQVDDLLDNSNFADDSGIQSIVNAPLNFINSLSNTCSPINLTIPFIDEPLQIPCIKQELSNHIPLVVPILSTAINGFIVYRILLDLVRIVKNSRNPDDDRIEVLDL